MGGGGVVYIKVIGGGGVVLCFDVGQEWGRLCAVVPRRLVMGV